MTSIQMRTLRTTLIIFGAIIGFAFTPTISSAQEDPLSATIRAAITSDAQSENLTQEEIDAMVAALAKEAQVEGVTAGDIVWRPQETTFAESNTEIPDSCAGSFLCKFNEVFGFSDGNLIPWFLLIVSMGLIFVIGTMMEMHKSQAAHSMSAPPPPVQSQRGNMPPPSGSNPPTSLYQ